ncbi:MAG: acetyl-CoA carboxylase biotin carboxyl carrier protein subunit [Saprospiraceae bacterium]|nr:acetyl-CoA carboxylase biotin carboxyl carrier protein subunit [Saprospiraceae bacterium]
MTTKPRYTLSVDERFEFQDLQAGQLDMVPGNDPGHFHILKDNRSYHAEIVELDIAAKRCVVKVNGKTHEVTLTDAYDHLVKEMGLSTAVLHKINAVHAPMPGLVFEIVVKPGDEVHRGDPILILEAMKMENVLKSPGDGVIKTICVEKGAPVEKGQLLIELA